MGALRELLAFFKVDVDTKELEKGESAIEAFKGTLKEAAEVVAEAFAVDKIKEFVEAQIGAGAQLKRTAEQLGTETDELQALQLAAGEAGVSVDAMTAGLRFLNRNLGEAAQGGEKALVFKKLGIAVKDANGQIRPAGDVMGDLADAIAEMPNAAEKTTTAMKLLGRGGVELIPLLNKGGEAFQEARKSMQELGGGMSKEFVESAEKAEAANVRLEFSMKGLKSTIANAMLPGFTDVVEEFTKVTVGAVKFTKETTGVTTALIFFGTVGAVKAVSGLVPLVGKLLEMDVALFGAEVPLLVVIAGLALLYLAFDDVFALLNGGESVIGDMLDHFFGIGTAAQFAKDLKEALAATGDVVVDLGALVLNALAAPFEVVFHMVKGLGEALGDIAGGNFEAAGKSLAKGLDDAQKGFDARRKKVGQNTDDLEDDVSLTAEQRKQKKINARNAGQTFDQGAALLARDGADGQKRNFLGDTAYQGAPQVVPKNFVETGAGGGGTQVVQHNTTKIDFHGDINDAKKTADTTTQGVTDGNARALNRALNAKRKP
jgi:hypothetical protein